jgi:hypothetical protein
MFISCFLKLFLDIKISKQQLVILTKQNRKTQNKPYKKHLDLKTLSGPLFSTFF